MHFQLDILGGNRQVQRRSIVCVSLNMMVIYLRLMLTYSHGGLPWQLDVVGEMVNISKILMGGNQSPPVKNLKKGSLTMFFLMCTTN